MILRAKRITQSSDSETERYPWRRQNLGKSKKKILLNLQTPKRKNIGWEDRILIFFKVSEATLSALQSLYDAKPLISQWMPFFPQLGSSSSSFYACAAVGCKNWYGVNSLFRINDVSFFLPVDALFCARVEITGQLAIKQCVSLDSPSCVMK